MNGGQCDRISHVMPVLTNGQFETFNYCSNQLSRVKSSMRETVF